MALERLLSVIRKSLVGGLMDYKEALELTLDTKVIFRPYNLLWWLLQKEPEYYWVLEEQAKTGYLVVNAVEYETEMSTMFGCYKLSNPVAVTDGYNILFCSPEWLSHYKRPKKLFAKILLLICNQTSKIFSFFRELKFRLLNHS
jgi:hypothetical protein